ncbi:hypothetical protein PTKIN_Ptkin10aG0114300 [Pterospermum kingtungense]
MTARFVGTIKSFWDSIGEYRQLQWFNTPTVTEAISYLAQIFSGQELHRMDKLREQFFKLKCCSLHPKDLARHYQKFSELFYLLGGLDDVNMKQAFLNSVPDDLAQQTRTQCGHGNSIEDRNREHQHHHHHHNVENTEIGLFTIDELLGFYAGKTLPIFFPIKDHTLYPPFLPKHISDTIPFSSSQVSTILKLFSVSLDSPKGKAVQDTLKKCEIEAAQGETKICATSLQTLHGFLRKAFGPEVDFNLLLPYDATETKVFKLSLVGDSTGDKVEALVVCHMDTSGWSSNHVAFRSLGFKHGSSVCHVFAQGNIVWIQPSPPIAAM